MSKARLADPAKRPTFDAMLAEVEQHIGLTFEQKHKSW